MTTTSIELQKLGKLPVRVDVRTLLLARYVDTSQLPAAPGTLDLTEHVPDWPMYANDRIGDCTIAAAGHMIEVWTAAARGEAVEVSESSVLTAFDRVKIVDPVTGEEGAVELDVLRDWRSHGVGHHRIAAYARVSGHDHTLVQSAAWLFGGLYIGLALPVSAQQQRVWDWTGSLSGDARPGSWGGHAVNVVALRRLGTDRRHVGPAAGADLGILGSLLRRVLLHPLARLPGGGPGAERFRPPGVARRPRARDRLTRCHGWPRPSS